MVWKTWELLKKDVNLAMTPLFTRRNTYEDGAVELRKILTTFFLNEDVATTLIEPTKVEQRMFDFNLVKDQMAKCLIVENELTSAALRLKQELGTAKPSLVTALDAQVLNCGLPFLLEDESYRLAFDKPFTHKAHNFMMQFAHALTLYRVYLHIYEVYHNLLNDTFLNLEQDDDCLSEAQWFKKRGVENIIKEDLPNLVQQINKSKKVVWSRLDLLKPHKMAYKDAFSSESKILPYLFKLGARKIEACYRDFPNDSTYTFLLYDTSWHKLLKNIAARLFEKQYTYSSFSSTLTILSEFSEKQDFEITNFQSVVLDKLVAYKIALLIKALRVYDKVLLNIRAKAAEEGVSLAYVSDTNFFQPSKTIYHYMSECMLERGLYHNPTIPIISNFEEQPACEYNGYTFNF
jgi:hypothetical protein